MKPSDFYIGLEFICGAFWYRRTDIGSRTVVAIRLAEDDSIWYKGPPCMIEEAVLDEAELKNAHLSEKDHIRAALDEADTSGYPNYAHEAVSRMMDERLDGHRYPRMRRLLQFDRVRGDGEILHPYAARQRTDTDLDAWVICLFLPFSKEWAEIEESEFMALPLSTPSAVRARADRENSATS